MRVRTRYYARHGLLGHCANGTSVLCCAQERMQRVECYLRHDRKTVAGVEFATKTA